MTGVRWHRDRGLEGRCDACCQWWPLDEDLLTYWFPARGMRQCRACQREETARRSREVYPHRMTQLEYVEKRRAYQREYMRIRRRLLGDGGRKAA